MGCLFCTVILMDATTRVESNRVDCCIIRIDVLSLHSLHMGPLRRPAEALRTGPSGTCPAAAPACAAKKAKW